MFQAVSRAIFHARGWTVAGEDLSRHKSCVVIAAPHTSNWDMIFMLGAFDVLGLPLRFTIKRSWMRFPFNLVIGPVGGIAIDRRPRADTGERPSLVEAMIRLFDDYPQGLALAITPEGTRERRDQWKSGFYHVARGAEVPILLGYLDYEKREAGVGKVIIPGDDFAADMKQIMDFYADITPCRPENFSLDQRFVDP